MSWFYRRADRTKRETCDLPVIIRYDNQVIVFSNSDNATHMNVREGDIWQCDTCGDYWVLKGEPYVQKWFWISEKSADKKLVKHIAKEEAHG